MKRDYYARYLWNRWKIQLEMIICDVKVTLAFKRKAIATLESIERIERRFK
jgi:hypothetical protein